MPGKSAKVTKLDAWIDGALEGVDVYYGRVEPPQEVWDLARKMRDRGLPKSTAEELIKQYIEEKGFTCKFGRHMIRKVWREKDELSKK